MGIGSAADQKFLVRVQGPSSSPEDDELLEGKAVSSRSGVACLDNVTVPPTLRIILGARHIGRLKHRILLAGPDASVLELGSKPTTLRNWSIRSWDPTYREVNVSDLGSPEDLSEIVYDAGVQLGQGSLREQEGENVDAARRQTLAMVGKFERKFRSESIALVDELMRGWKQLTPAAPRN
jgi:hypothetical protein